MGWSRCLQNVKVSFITTNKNHFYQILPFRPFPFLSDHFLWYFLTKMFQWFNVSPCTKEVPPIPTLNHTSSLVPTKESFLISFLQFPVVHLPSAPYIQMLDIPILPSDRHTNCLPPPNGQNSITVHSNLHFSLSRCYMWKIQVFWNVALHHLVSSSPHPEVVLAPSSFGQAVQWSTAILKTSELLAHQQCHIPDETQLQQRCSWVPHHSHAVRTATVPYDSHAVCTATVPHNSRALCTATVPHDSHAVCTATVPHNSRAVCTATFQEHEHYILKGTSNTSRTVIWTQILIAEYTLTSSKILLLAYQSNITKMKRTDYAKKEHITDLPSINLHKTETM